MSSPHRSPMFPAAALWLIFFVNGAVLASWAPRIPEVKDDLALSDSALGIALFGVAAGSVPALLGTGRLLRRVSARATCIAAACAFAASLPAIATTTNAPTLTLVLALIGAASGCLDVAMNTAAIGYQRSQARTPVISRLHGGYSLGVLVGAAGGALATALSIGIAVHFTVVSIILTALVGVAAAHLPSRHPARAGAATVTRKTRRSPRPAIVAVPPAIAVLAVSSLLVEGTITDWSALLISRDFDGGYGLGSSTVVAFGVAMFCSRSVSDWISARVGRAGVLYVSAAATAVACVIGLGQPSPIVAMGAIVAIGCGLGPVFPLVMSIATERRPAAIAEATAAVSAFGYLAYLGGPPIIGLIAERTGLTAAVIAVGTLCAAISALGTRRLGSSQLHRAEHLPT